jgi:hypothetical protein
MRASFEFGDGPAKPSAAPASHLVLLESKEDG